MHMFRFWVRRVCCPSTAFYLQKYPFFFPREKQETFTKFGNLTEGKIFGTLRVPIFGKKAKIFETFRIPILWSIWKKKCEVWKYRKLGEKKTRNLDQKTFDKNDPNFTVKFPFWIAGIIIETKRSQKTSCWVWRVCRVINFSAHQM